jgi:hypothetical protein
VTTDTLVREFNMTLTERLEKTVSQVTSFAALALLVCQIATAQECVPLNWTAEQDHQNMMDQLGIKRLRASPSGNEKEANHANYDEEKAPIHMAICRMRSRRKTDRRSLQQTSGGISDARRLSRTSSAEVVGPAIWRNSRMDKRFDI